VSFEQVSHVVNSGNAGTLPNIKQTAKDKCKRQATKAKVMLRKGRLWVIHGLLQSDTPWKSFPPFGVCTKLENFVKNNFDEKSREEKESRRSEKNDDDDY
jgi:hypothetical protein